MVVDDQHENQQSAAPLVQRIPIEDLPAHLATLEAELEDGRHIEVLRGGAVIADLRAPARLATQGVLPASERPDFMARLKEMWGDRVFEDSTELIRKDRDAGS